MIARVLRARLNRKCQTKILSFGFAPFMGTEPLKLNAVVAAWVKISVADRDFSQSFWLFGPRWIEFGGPSGPRVGFSPDYGV